MIDRPLGTYYGRPAEVSTSTTLERFEANRAIMMIRHAHPACGMRRRRAPSRRAVREQGAGAAAYASRYRPAASTPDRALCVADDAPTTGA